MKILNRVKIKPSRLKKFKKDSKFILAGVIFVFLLFGFLKISFVQAAIFSPYQNPFHYGIKTGSNYLGFLPTQSACTGSAGGLGQCLLWLLDKTLRVVYTLALFLAVIFLIWAGIIYITKPGNAPDAHKRLYYGLTGIIVAVLAFSIVQGLELTLSGTTPPPVSGTGGGAGSTQAQPAQVVITDLGYNNQRSGLTGFAGLNGSIPANAGVCSLSASVYNVTQGTQLPVTGTIISPPGGFLLLLSSLNAQPGDNLRVVFSSNNVSACTVPESTYSYTLPSAPIAVQPTQVNIPYGGITIYGAQSYSLSGLNNNNIISWITNLGFGYLNSSYLYDPPFYVQINYLADNPNSAPANCAVQGLISGIYVSGLNNQNINSITQSDINTFNQPVSFYLNNIPATGGQAQSFSTAYMSLGLFNNTYQELKLSIQPGSDCVVHSDYASPRQISIHGGQ